jgi:hypothetical protein
MTDKTKYSFCKRLTGDLYKTLPIYEGEDINGKVIANPFDAHENYLKHLIILEAELNGAYEYYGDDAFLSMLLLVKGMKKIDIGNHRDVKDCVFKLIKMSEGITHGI